MHVIMNDIQDREVYPIVIKSDKREYLTLYYYTLEGDSVLHNSTHFICFSTIEKLATFCTDHALHIAQKPTHFDFDVPIKDRSDYSAHLNNWNLISTIANVFSMYFEGNCRKYTPLYNRLFQLNTAAGGIPGRINLRKKYTAQLITVFKKKNRFLRRFSVI